MEARLAYLHTQLFFPQAATHGEAPPGPLQFPDGVQHIADVRRHVRRGKHHTGRQRPAPRKAGKHARPKAKSKAKRSAGRRAKGVVVVANVGGGGHTGAAPRGHRASKRRAPDVM